MTSEEKILALLKTGKASIETNKHTLFVWEDCGDTIFEVIPSIPDGLDDIESEKYLDNPLYQGTSFKRALNVLANSIK